GKGNLDPGAVQRGIHRNRDLATQAEVRLLRGPEYQQEIQAARSECEKESAWLRIPEHLGMATGDGQQKLDDALRVVSIGDRHLQFYAPDGFAERPVDDLIGNQIRVRHDYLGALDSADQTGSN